MLIIVAIPMSGSPAFTKSRKWKPPDTDDHRVSWHPNRGGVGAGTADDARHQDSPRVSPHSLRDREADRHHQCRGGCVGHEVCQCTAENKNGEGQKVRGRLVAECPNHRVGDEFTSPCFSECCREGKGTAKEEDGPQINSFKSIFL